MTTNKTDRRSGNGAAIKFPQLYDRDWLTEHRALTNAQIAQVLGCSIWSVREAFSRELPHAKQRGVKARFPDLYDVEWMTSHAHLGIRGIADKLGCTGTAVRYAIGKLGLDIFLFADQPRLSITDISPWPELSDRAWLESHRSRRRSEITQILGCHEEAVSAAYRLIGSRLKSGSRVKYAQLSDPEWLQNKSYMSGKEIAELLGCSTETVHRASRSMGIPLATKRSNSRRPTSKFVTDSTTSTAEFTIRPMQERDIIEVCDLMGDAAEPPVGGHYSPRELGSMIPSPDWDLYIASRNDDASIFGFMAIHRLTLHRCIVDRIYISNMHSYQGIGTSLMIPLRKTMTRWGVSSSSILVDESDIEMMTWLRINGLKELPGRRLIDMNYDNPKVAKQG